MPPRELNEYGELIESKTPEELAREQIEAEEKAAKRAAFLAEPVQAKVLLLGHKRIFTGEQNNVGEPPKTYSRGDIISVQRGIAHQLERRGFIDVLPDAPKQKSRNDTAA